MNRLSTEPSADPRSTGRIAPMRPSPARVSVPPVAVPTVPPTAALLEAAAQDVLRTWADRLSESVDHGEFVLAVDWIRDAVATAMRDEQPPPPDVQLTLSRFLLERFSSSLLSLIGTDPRTDKADTVLLLRGIDRVRQRIEPEWDRYFASQFAGPDGLSLVTEVAHDLRSPLTSIRCLAEALERGQSGPVTEVQRKQLRLIYSAALGLGTMASDVIEIARRGDQLVDVESVPFSVAEVVEGVADMVRPIAEEKGLALTTQRLASDQRIGAEFALSRVLLNLVTNALKFTDEGRVEIQVRPTGLSTVEFAVVDTGRGIPDEAIGDLYRPFRRSSARAGRSGFLFSGTGLGLALCRKLVQAMGAELLLQTAPGEGTRFSFSVDLPPTTRL